MCLSLKIAYDRVTARVEHQIERIDAELYFAEQLCEIHTDRRAEWLPLIREARAGVEAVIAAGRTNDIEAAVKKAESIMAPIGAVARTYTMYCVGHAHIDMNWMWSWPETVAVTLDTFSTVLRFMEEYPTFRFSQSQASTYAIVKKHHPELLERIAHRVKEGRWEVTASHWVESDKNLASAESLCRHLLYTRRFMRELFGLKPSDVPVDWSPDSFGHAATTPSYLARGAVKYLYLFRPGVYTAEKPPAFWWEGPDGSRVLVYNDMLLGYSQKITPALLPHFLEFVRHTGGRDCMSVYGVGDHGGGPTRRDILQAIDMDSWPIMPRFRFSSAIEFFGALEKQADRLPVIRGELNTEFAGCYTSQSFIKKANRFSETRLVDAEFAASIAWAAAGTAYPRAEIEESWRDTLFSHFHDILPGSGIHDTQTYTQGLYQKICATTATIKTRALRLIAELVDTTAAGLPEQKDMPPSRLSSAIGAGVGFMSAEGGIPQSDQTIGHGPRPFVVFNPTAMDRNEIIETTIWNNAPDYLVPIQNRSFVVRGPDGSDVPAQILGGGGYWGHDFASVAFPVKVPSLGYAAHIVLEAGEKTCAETTSATVSGNASDFVPGTARLTARQHHCKYAMIERSLEALENDMLRVAFDMADGTIRSLLNKGSGIDIITQDGRGAGLEYAVERPHDMSAWLIENTGPVRSPEVTDFRKGKLGPYIASLEVHFRIEESEFTVSYELRANDPKLHIGISGTWFQRGTAQIGVPVLSFALPLALEQAAARYEIPFGAIDRNFNQGEEVPALQWAQVTGTISGVKAGCLLINDSKHGHSLYGHVLRLTLIRSSYDPDPTPEIGHHAIRLALLPFKGELHVEQAIREGQAFNHALCPVGTSVHSGSLKAVGQFFSVKSGPVLVSAVKKAEDQNGLVIRLFNPTPRKAAADISFNTDIIPPPLSVSELDLMELPLKSSNAKISGRSVITAVPAHGIVSLLVRYNKKAKTIGQRNPERAVRRRK